ncbi:MAG: hypothetical protein RL187_1013, partial [Actinomycetota bacterium]
ASTAAPIMVEVLERSFPERLEAWAPQLKRIIPSYGTSLAEDPKRARASLEKTAKKLGLSV